MPGSIGMIFTSNSTPAKSAPSGFNPVTMVLNKDVTKITRATTLSAPAIMTFSNLSAYKNGKGCRSCGGR